MALNIKNSRAEELVGRLARLTGRSKTQAVIVALEHELARLDGGQPDLETRVELSLAPYRATEPGPFPPVTKEEYDAIFE